jgi:2'-hydroxyisoflavone reductase
MELPLWLPEAEGPGTWRVDAARAEAAGLRARPIAETVADVWAWLQSGGPDAEGGADWRSPHAARGLAPEKEREVLAGVAR